MTDLETKIIDVLTATPGLSAAGISKRIPGSWSATLYPALVQMEAAGILRSEWGMKVSDKPRRRMYFVVTSAS